MTKSTISCIALYNSISEKLEAMKPARSAWERGVREYAARLLEDATVNAMDDETAPATDIDFEDILLGGAQDYRRPGDKFAAWSVYSWGGSALIYDGQIAERLCTPSELKRCKGGERQPNSREQWLDTQARALYQAAQLLKRLFREIKREEVA